MKDEIYPRVNYALQTLLRQLMSPRSFKRGIALYKRGMAATGFYLVESGSVRVSLPNKSGTRLLEIAGAGAVLGLHETVPGKTYSATVEAEEYTTAAFVARDDFLDLLGKHPEMRVHVIRMLSESLHGFYRKVRRSAHDLAGAR